MKGLEAVVLAGGLGTRLRGVVPDLPKSMAPIAGRPFLDILLGSLARRGVARAVLALGYRAEVVRLHFGERFGSLEIAYSIEDEPLGTGGALRLALTQCRTPAALVVNGDTFLDLDIGVLNARWQRDALPLIVGRLIDDTARFGRLRCEGDRITGFEPKGAPGPGLINSGHYLLPVDLFGNCDLPPRFSFESDFLPQAVQQRRFEVFVCAGDFIDIGVPEDFRRAQTELAAR